MAARESRINHPRGSVFIQLHVWAVQAFGRDGAAIIGALDFLDRAQEHGGQLVASRARLLADLEGLVSRYALDRALSDLVRLKLIKRVEREMFLTKNLTKTHFYALQTDAINKFIKERNIDVLNSERRRDESGTDSCSEIATGAGSESRTSTVLKEEIKEEREIERPMASVVPGALSNELIRLAISAAKRNPRTDIESDQAAISAAANCAAKHCIDEAKAAGAICQLRERGGWPRDALAAIEQLVAEQHEQVAVQAHEKALAMRPPGFDMAIVEKGERLLGRRGGGGHRTNSV